MRRRKETKGQAAMQVAGYIVLTLEFREEGDQWSGRCRELGTASCGDSLEEARKMLKELISLHLNSLEELGEREAFFKKHRIRLYKRKPARKKRIEAGLGDIIERMTGRVPAVPTMA